MWSDSSIVIVYQGEPTEHSISSKIIDDQSNLELSQPETPEETLCKKEQSKAEVCCSCTKKSLCKTKSCKCKANGSGCGDSCGCLASKCSNREEEIVKPDKPMQPVDGKKPAGISHEDKDANKQPLRDIGNIQVSFFLCDVYFMTNHHTYLVITIMLDSTGSSKSW